MSADSVPFSCGAAPAIVVSRGDLVESEHFVCHALVDEDGTVVSSSGDIDRPVYMRSSAKPLIATAVVRSGAADRFGLNEHEIALAAASHNGEPAQVASVRDMLAKTGLDASEFQCGAHAPSHEPSAQALCLAGHLPQPVHNNCSGKHAGILALAVQLGADPSGYLAPDHPAQQAILQTCADLLGVPQTSFVVGIDGCGIPVIAVPMRTVARFFARFGTGNKIPVEYRTALARVRSAMLAHPWYVAGSGRFDTDLMLAAHPRVVCKGGAEGYHASALIEQRLGLTVKVADGNYRAVSPFVLATLARVGAVGEVALGALAKHRRPVIRNHAGTVIGRVDLASGFQKT
ncbi:MAG: asparaginase [Candidatus Eremiobacteraeota bacterium]|nr:asparaginase [Candidatus Eremiobacteraeota bacterium]